MEQEYKEEVRNEEFELIAKTFMGLENVLAEELTQLGANNIQTGRRMVSFTGNKEMMYRANFQLRTAIRILKPIAHFKAQSAEDMYDEVKKIDWSRYIEKGKTFSVDSVVYSEEFRNSRFVTYKVKDAIVDQFRERTGDRPNISVANPDIRLHIHIAEDNATLSLDSSGESLHRRGYRQETREAPLNEVLAAGMILMTGWRGETDFIDPMCGSGTLPIEAALIARNISPGVFRKEFAFEKWPDFDADLFDEIYNDDSQERDFEHHIYGYDNDMKAVNTANLNVRAAGLTKEITISQQDFKDFTQPAEKSIIVMNPPYGERISTPNLLGLIQNDRRTAEACLRRQQRMDSELPRGMFRADRTETLYQDSSLQRFAGMRVPQVCHVRRQDEGVPRRGRHRQDRRGEEGDGRETPVQEEPRI